MIRSRSRSLLQRKERKIFKIHTIRGEEWKNERNLEPTGSAHGNAFAKKRWKALA